MSKSKSSTFIDFSTFEESHYFKNDNAKFNSDFLEKTNDNPLVTRSQSNYDYALKPEELKLKKDNIPSFSKTDELTLKTLKKHHSDEIDSVVTTIARNGKMIIDKYKDDIKIKDLTNTEEIVDFYEYLHDCLIKIKKIIPPSKETINNSKIDYTLNKTKCKYIFLIYIRQKAGRFRLRRNISPLQEHGL